MMSDDKKQWTDDDRKKLDDAELDQAIGGAGKNPALGTPGGKKKPDGPSDGIGQNRGDDFS
ncbi:MAG TPA: hypothetical protein EYN79_08905 [Planctomycetes bacterium]|nr:hypothetical protein [Planctomycetota bacterium]